MNRNTALTLIFTIVLMVSFSIQSNSAKADSNEHCTFASGLTLYSPLNKTYNSSLLQLNLTFESGAGLQGFLNYSIDGKYQGPIPLTFNSTTGFEMVGLGYGLVQLPEFSNGPHVLIVNVGFYNSSGYCGSWVHTIYFTIDASEVVSTPTPTLTSTPTPTPTPTPSPIPTASPAPTSTQTANPTASPTSSNPTATSTTNPTLLTQSPTSSPSPTPTVPEFQALSVLALFLAISLAITLVVKTKKRV